MNRGQYLHLLFLDEILIVLNQSERKKDIAWQGFRLETLGRNSYLKRYRDRSPPWPLPHFFFSITNADYGGYGQKHLKKRCPVPSEPIRTLTGCMQRGQFPT